MKRNKRKPEDDFNFWKFLIVLSVMLNAVNFYFVSGLYNVSNKDFSIPLSNTAIGNITGYFVFGYSPLTVLASVIVIISIYVILRKWVL